MSIFKHTFRMTSSPHERWNIASNASHFRIVVTGNKLLNNISISLQKKKKANRADDYPKRSKAHP